MATVGLIFGAANSGQGFDVASTVTSILAISSAIETPWKTQLASLAAQDTAFTTIGTHLSALSSALSSLTAFDGLLTSKQGSSSDSNSLTLTSASTSAVAGSHTVLINALAQTGSEYSSRIPTAHAADTFTGSLSIKVGTAPAQSVPITGTSTTLTALASQINLGSYGVTASVVSDTLGSRLSLVSNTPGLAGDLAVSTGLTDATTGLPVTFAIGQHGLDADLTVDGLDTTSASNTVTGAIPGVTFQLLAQSANPIQIQISNDNTSIENAFQSLVTAYNAVVADIKTQEGKDSTGAAQPLFGDRTLALIQTQLSAGLFGGAASGAIGSIDQLGLTVGQDGTLSLNASTLDAALNSKFADVSGFLQADLSWGSNFSKILNQVGSTSQNGALSLAKIQNASQETQLNANIAKEELLISAQKISLTAELNLANQILQSIPGQMNEQDQLYAAITGYNTKG